MILFSRIKYSMYKSPVIKVLYSGNVLFYKIITSGQYHHVQSSLKAKPKISKALECCKVLYTVYMEIFTYNLHFSICFLIHPSSFSVGMHAHRAVFVYGCPVSADGTGTVVIAQYFEYHFYFLPSMHECYTCLLMVYFVQAV